LQIIRAKIPDTETIEKNIDIISKLNQTGEFYITKSTMFVNCGDNNAVELTEIKPENKNTLLIKNFINGYKGDRQGVFLSEPRF
jgi:methionyl-tRNA formyltransferase